MKGFLDEEFLLTTDMARNLYHRYAEKMPIFDYHCHLDQKEIYENRCFDNLTQVWLEKDHYKWRLMRSNGIEERYITGDASDREKFQKWVETLELAIGNPLYHWSHLELKRFFGYEGYLCRATAEEVWNLCCEKLQNGMTAQKMIEMANVELIGTTDDPVDTLEWHEKIAEEDTLKVMVVPTWRPERAMNINHPEYIPYLEQLGTVSGVKIDTYSDLLDALRVRMDHFENHHCRISDHSLDRLIYMPGKIEEVNAIFQKRLQGRHISETEKRMFETDLLLVMGQEYQKRNWVMQIHLGVKRDNNKLLYEKLGADAGADCMNNGGGADQMAAFLNALSEKGQLPKTILYSLNPADNAVVGTVMGCFQGADAVGKIQQGSAWWFNDHKSGMIDQITSLANLGLLGNFIGMLTDSRSFLSYTRHEYFRRILCNLIGTWVECGEYPDDQQTLERIIKGIAYENAVRYFDFKGLRKET